MSKRHVLELDAEILADLLAGGQDGDVLEHRLAAIAEARRLDGRDLEATAQLVDHQGGERLALDVLGDDQQRPARLHDQFEEGQQRLQARQLLLMDEDVRVLELGDHLLGVGDEVRREIAAVELHAFDDLELGLHALGFLDGDHAVLADLVHRLGDHVADRFVAIGRDGADLGDLLAGRDLLRAALEFFDHQFAGQIDAALEVHRVHAGGDRLGAFAHDRLGEHGRRGGAVAGGVRRPGRHFAHQLGAHVLELVGKLDLLGDGDAVLGDARRAVRLVEHDIAALGAERDLHRVGQDIDAADHAGAGVAAKTYFFRCHGFYSLFEMLGRCRPALRRLLLGDGDTWAFDDAHDVRLLHDQEILAVELDLRAGPLAEQDAVAFLDVERHDRALLVAGARADGDDLALHRLFLGGVRNDDAALGLAFFLDTLDHDAVVKRTELHGSSSNFLGFGASAERALQQLVERWCALIN